ncbi:uncharacterized protein DS421_13g420050 [Arachis hypogaea]|nr:uncharacterized protein DS421_13g420050 [Arachis hypogaea]
MLSCHSPQQLLPGMEDGCDGGWPLKSCAAGVRSTHCLPQYPRRRKKQTNEGEGRAASVIWFVEPSPLLVDAVQGRREDARAQGRKEPSNLLPPRCSRSSNHPCRRRSYRDQRGAGDLEGGVAQRGALSCAPPSHLNTAVATAILPSLELGLGATGLPHVRSTAFESYRRLTSYCRSCLLSYMAAREVVVAAGTTAGASGYFFDPPEILAAAGAIAGAGSKSQLLRVVIPCCFGYCESSWELRFWLPSVRVEAEKTL